MRSPNFTVFLIVGFYFSIIFYQRDAIALLGSCAVFIIFWAAVLPAALLVRGQPFLAISMVAMIALLAVVVTLIQERSFSLGAMARLLDAPGLPLYAFLLLPAPGFFLVNQLDPARLPHELSHWSGIQIFSPLVAVIAGRERVNRRIAEIRQSCILRGIPLERRVDFLLHPTIWLVPLVTATICEAAYAYKFREMIGAPHRFVPTRPKKPVLSFAQKIATLSLVAVVIFGIPRACK